MQKLLLLSFYGYIYNFR